MPNKWSNRGFLKRAVIVAIVFGDRNITNNVLLTLGLKLFVNSLDLIRNVIVLMQEVILHHENISNILSILNSCTIFSTHFLNRKFKGVLFMHKT